MNVTLPLDCPWVLGFFSSSPHPLTKMAEASLDYSGSSMAVLREGWVINEA